MDVKLVATTTLVPTGPIPDPTPVPTGGIAEVMGGAFVLLCLSFIPSGEWF